MAHLAGRLSSPPAPLPRRLESPSPNRNSTTTAATTTTVIRSPEDLLEALHNDVDAKIETARATHHMTYGVLLRELERAVRERHESDAAVAEARRKQSAAESATANALARVRELEQELQRSQVAQADTERSMLQWQQRCESLHGDVLVLKRDLERAVHDADHNRQLLAMEVRSRSQLLTSMHDDILKRRSMAAGSTSASALAPGDHDSSAAGGGSQACAQPNDGGSSSGFGQVAPPGAETQVAATTTTTAVDAGLANLGSTNRRWSPTRTTRQAEAVSPGASRLSLLTSPPPLPHEGLQHSVGRSLLNGWVSPSVSMLSPSATAAAGTSSSRRPPSWLQ